MALLRGRLAGFALATAILAGPAVGLAQDGRPTLVILDASSSTADFLIGTSKLDAQRAAVRALAARLAPRMSLALLAFGHRSPNACNDIAALLPLGTHDAAAISAATATLAPRGRTPLAGALGEASRILGPARNAAVVLVTDGIETCGGDPCAAARELVAAHPGTRIDVVAMDLGWPRDRARLACIAAAGNGRLLRADTPIEVERRMAQAALLEPVAPANLRRVELRAMAGGKPTKAAFRIVGSDGDAVDVEGSAATLTPGRYMVHASAGHNFGSAEQVVATTGGASVTVRLDRPVPKVELAIDARPVVAGGRVSVRFSGKPAAGDSIALRRVDGAETEFRAQVAAGAGPAAEMRVPDEPGLYEARYIHGPTGRVVGTGRVEIVAATATLSAPAAASVGARVDVRWTGPNGEGDAIVVASPDAGPALILPRASAPVAAGDPASLLLPASPGAYEIRYVTGGRARVLGAVPIRVSPADARIDAPAQAMAGSPVEVTFAGPLLPGAFIGIIEPPQADANTILGAFAPLEERRPLLLTAPGRPGDYEIRYVIDGAGGHAAIARRALRLAPPAATLGAPDKAGPRQDLEIRATGPLGPDDSVILVPVGAPDDAPGASWSSRDGRQGQLLTPAEPGDYELRYVMDAPLTGKVVLVRRRVAIMP